MSTSVVQIKTLDAFRILTISRPDALNALNRQVFNELEAFFQSHTNDPSVKGVIITGEGEKAFVAGADIKEFTSLDQQEGMRLSKRGQDIFFMIEQFHAPVVAAVNGYALGGGCELAMACHLRIASQHARFGQPEVNLGLIPGYGGSQRLPRLVGKTKAMEMLLTGNMITAEEGYRLGLVNYVTESSDLIPKSLEMLNVIATKAPLAVRETIRILHAQEVGDMAGYKDEYTTFGNLLITADAKEGATAFAEKRKPVFSGK